MFRVRSRFGGCLRRFAGFSTLRGATGRYFTWPVSLDVVGMSQAVWPFSLPTCSLSVQIWRTFAPSLRGCLRRSGRYDAGHLLLSEQFWEDVSGDLL
eukprot:190025-Pyramimonas_sp.AAC.1